MDFDIGDVCLIEFSSKIPSIFLAIVLTASTKKPLLPVAPVTSFLLLAS